MADNDKLMADVLRAAGWADAAVLMEKLSAVTAPAPAAAPPEPAPEPEPVATGPVPVAPSPYGRPNPEGEAAYALAALRRDIPRLAPPPATPSVDDERGEAA